MSKKPAPPPPGDRPLKTLERVVSKSGIGSRKEARALVAAGRVSVNGVTVRDADAWIDLERDAVAIDGRRVAKPEPLHILFNKPKGVVTTRHDRMGRPTIYDVLPHELEKLLYVGRLDLDTSGLLILTNDTALAERLTNPRYKVPKRYRVIASPPLSDARLDQLRAGIELDDGPTRPAVVEPMERGKDHIVLMLTITEGRNRQVRRMIAAVGSEVLDLERVAIGEVTIEGLAPGEWRRMTDEEVTPLVAGAE